MRTKQAFKNALMSLLLQITLALSGIIIPRFFISLYGSPVNGLVSSITQFITYMGLVEAGIGAAGTVALYRPIADKNVNRINGIVSAARSFYMRSGVLFTILLIALVIFYPYAVNNEIQDITFIRTMIVVLSVNGIVDYFYLGKYRVILLADQHGYIISIAQIVGTVVMTIVCIIMMELNCSAILVKMANAIIYLLRSFAVGIYVKKHYKYVNFRAVPDFKAYDQRWAALLHQVVGMIVNSSGAVLLTLMISANALAEVSVYSVYNLVGYGLYGLMNSISNGLGAGFGEVISKDERGVLYDSFSSYEYVYFLIIFITYTCMEVLMYPFIALYSGSFTDGVVYLRWPLVILFTLTGLFQTLRLPGLTIICSAGHYKQTRGRALLEAIINLTVSIVLVRKLGIVGVLVGACASYLYRTTDVIIYTAKNFLLGTLKRTVVRILRNMIILIVLSVMGVIVIPMDQNSWFGWIVSAVIFGIITCVVFIGLNAICEPDEFRNFILRIKNTFAIKVERSTDK